MTATRNKHVVHFSARLHEVAANHNAGIGVGVVDQLWRHRLLLFSCVLVNQQRQFIVFAVIFLFNYVDFMRYET